MHRPTPRQLVYLRAIGTQREMTVRLLAGRVGVADRTARSKVATLVDAGWVETMRLRRPMFVRLTPAGLVAVIAMGARAFVDEMAAQGIHLGFGTPPNCPTCRAPYPCAKARR